MRLLPGGIGRVEGENAAVGRDARRADRRDFRGDRDLEAHDARRLRRALPEPESEGRRGEGGNGRHRPGELLAALAARERPARAARPASRPRRSTGAGASTSCAVWKRSSGSLARHVRTTRFRAGGVIGATAEIGAGSSRHDRGDQRRLALARERLLARRHLVEHARRRRRCRCARRPPCPRAAPAPCTGRCRAPCPARSAAGSPGLRVARRETPDAAAPRTPAWYFARPKSRSLTPDFVSITLPGFRSRWTMPWRCALSSASAISMP